MNLERIEDYFPQGIAKGNTFLGRDNEINWLIGNIQSNHHTLLLAPRRFGKTSLALNTLERLQLPNASIDLHLALSVKSIEKKLLKTVTILLKTVSTKNDQLLKIVQHFFSLKNKKWTLGFKGVAGVELIPEHNDPLDNILTALELLESALSKNKLRAVIFIDEFQEIHSIENGYQAQGAIRSFAQTSKNLVFIFSGSSRRMLSHLFGDKSQPMYELCERIILNRIEPHYYENYINALAVKTWKKPLPKEAMETLFQLSELHPKRVYNLCYYLWKMTNHEKSIPLASEVQNAWNFFVKQRVKDLRTLLSSISAGQLKVLTLIASKKTEELTGKTAQTLTNMAGSSIVKAIGQLAMEDYIEENGHGKYQIIDPLISYFLVNYELENINIP